MIIDIKVPSPGESITEVELTTWYVHDGDFVKKDQELAELESDKATLTISADQAGKISIKIPEGETAEVGAIACSIDTSEVGVNTEPTEAAITKDTNQEKVIAIANESSTTEEKSDLKITPVAKNKLKEQNISIDEFKAKLDRITSSDVDFVLNQEEHTRSDSPNNKERLAERKKMSPLRKKLSKRLVQVKNETAMLTTFNELDMSNVMALRAKYKKAFEEKFGIKLGFMSFFTKAASIALQHHPNVNAMIDGEEIVYFNYTDIAIAVQTPKGLMVPVIRDIDKKSIAETEGAIAQMAKKARAGKISLEEMSGGTFTITNGGVFGSLLSTPIINPPQAAILGMHNIKERPIAENGQVVIRPMMYTALSYDHRLVDGKDSVGFLVKLKELIENPEQMLFDGEDLSKKLILG